MGSSLEIRRAEGWDVEDVATMSRTFTLHHLIREYEEWVHDQRHILVVARKDGKLVGFALFLKQSATWMNVEAFFVRPSHRSSGAALALWQFARDCVPSEVEFLSTSIDSLEAVRALRAVGFVPGPTYTFYYRWLKPQEVDG